MLAALNFVLGASIRRLWALRTQRKSIERDVCAPVVLAHQHVVAPIWVQRDPERINHNHKSRSIGYKPLRSEDEPVHIEGSFCWCWSSREGGVGLVSEWAFWKLKHRTFCLTVRCSSDVLKKTSPLDVFGDVSEKVKHLTNDASNDVSPPALLVGFVQFDLKLSHHTTTFRGLHLHFGMETFWPQVAKGAKEPRQFVPVWMGHFENRNDSQSLATIPRTVKSLNRHFFASSKLAPPWAEVCTALQHWM